MSIASRINRIGANRASDTIFDVCIIIIGIIIFFIVAYPLYFIIIASFSDSTLVAQGKVLLFPKAMSTYGYEQIFKDARIWTGYSNTIIYTVVGTTINLIVTIPAAYALARREFVARRFIMSAFVFTMFFNGGMVPTYMVIRDLQLIDKIWAVVLPGAVSVYNLIITRTFFENSLPNELYEASVIDGCTHFQYFFAVAVPLSKAVISVITLYYMVGHWNSFFGPLLYLNNNARHPLQIVLRDILLSNQVFAEGVGLGGADGSGSYAQRYADQIKFGVIIVSTIPILCVYPFIQKYFERGVMIGALKG